VSDIRFYTDEHVARAVTTGLRLRGANVLTVPDAGTLGASDEQHLAFALAERRVIFTQDDDFLRLAAQDLAHAGIVCASQHTPIGSIVRDLLLIYHVLTAEEMIGAVEFLR
jgi:uncharacterized protein with PIN domain